MSVSEISKRVFKIAKKIQSGESSPLDIQLTEEYQELQVLVARVDARLDIDEMLNDILEAKISKVQELARVLTAPEVYVEKLKLIKTRRLGKLIAVYQPLVLSRLDPRTLTQSLDRVMEIIDAISQEPPEDQVPDMTDIPTEIHLKSEDALFSEEMDEFERFLPVGEKILLSDLLETNDMDLFLRRFLFVIVLITKGSLVYFKESREILRT